jgi:murein DD-endopeptidase MepM/ murein hydrolase activator NlpD
MAFSAVMAVIPALPASAQVVKAETTTGTFQTLAVAADVSVTKTNRDSFGASTYSLVQAPVPLSTKISSPYGWRIAPCAGCSTWHRGIDLLAGNGNPVESIADGTVVEIGNPSGSLGVYVEIAHVIDGKKVNTVYAHMASGSMTLSVGDVVKRGQVVGRVGSTGQSTGPHLYFQVLLNGTTPTDPTPWLAANVTTKG